MHLPPPFRNAHDNLLGKKKKKNYVEQCKTVFELVKESTKKGRNNPEAKVFILLLAKKNKIFWKADLGLINNNK